MKSIEASLHVTGETRYVDDLPVPERMLHAQVFGSPSAHGRLQTLDTAEAARQPGVVGVLTAGDIPGSNVIGPILQDEQLLADEAVHYMGQPLAVVVAESWRAARRSLRCLTADIEDLPVVTDPREAFAQGHIIDQGRTFEIGDVDAAWARCDVVVEGTCDLGGQEHVYLETQRARAMPGEDGTMLVLSSTQSPYAVQKSVARILGVPHHKVEVDVARIGGGFGGKEDQATHWACMAALAAARYGRPVELVLHRADDMRMTGKRHPYLSDFKLGLDRDGRILAFEARHFQNAGAFADLSTAVLERTLFHSTNAYRVPNARIFAACCRTNLPPSTAFRGFGGPQGMFVIEAALARAAEVTGTSREELQRLNLLREGDTFSYGQRAERTRAVETWDQAADTHDLAGLREAVTRHNQEHGSLKKGLAVMPVCFGISFTKTFLNQAGALVHVYTDGSVSVSTGGVEMGQGHSTKVRDIAARALGIDADRVRVEGTNTRRVANMSASAASATTDLNGWASLNAIEKLLGRLRVFAAEHHDVKDPLDINVRGERVLAAGRDTGWDWSELVLQAHLNRVDLTAHGFYSTPHVHFDRDREMGHPFAYHVYGAAIVQVVLDGLRGIYDIEKIGIVHDLGRSVNPLVDLGQVEGGLAQGLGWMSVEDLQFDARGRLLSNALSTYKVPDVHMMPDDFMVDFLEDEDNPAGPFGSKAVGEPPLMYGIGLYFAVRDALRAFRPETEFPFVTPMTPERVLMELVETRVPAHTNPQA